MSEKARAWALRQEEETQPVMKSLAFSGIPPIMVFQLNLPLPSVRTLVSLGDVNTACDFFVSYSVESHFPLLFPLFPQLPLQKF